MIHPSTIKFLADLKKNNNREWFEKNRKNYEFTKQNFLDLTSSVLQGICEVDNTLITLEPKKCVFRINRDVRFSKDKSPYKSNMGMSISKGGKNSSYAGYYFHIETEQCFIGGGLYMPMADVVKNVRQEIDYNWNDFKKIISNKRFVTTYKELNTAKEYSLIRPPKGYEETNPAIHYLKLKSWIAGTSLTNEELGDKNLAKHIVKKFEILKPLLDYLNKAVDS